MAWTIQPSKAFIIRLNDYGQRFTTTRQELMLATTRYLELLNRDIDPYDPLIEFVHVIKKGIVSIADGLMATSDLLYAFPDRFNRVLHLLLMGQREQQDQDVINCEIQVQLLHQKLTAE